MRGPARDPGHFERAGFARTAQDDRALNLVAAGIGIALMPALFSAPDVARVPISDLPITRTLVVRKKDKPTNCAEAIF